MEDSDRTGSTRVMLVATQFAMPEQDFRKDSLMKPHFCFLLGTFLLLTTASAQQTTAPKAQNQKKQAAAPPSAEPAPAAKPEPSAKPEQALAAPPSTGDKEKDKEEHFDMTEVPPIVTHHQITADGHVLSYTATAGPFTHQARGRKD